MEEKSYIESKLGEKTPIHPSVSLEVYDLEQMWEKYHVVNNLKFELLDSKDYRDRMYARIVLSSESWNLSALIREKERERYIKELQNETWKDRLFYNSFVISFVLLLYIFFLPMHILDILDYILDNIWILLVVFMALLFLFSLYRLFI